jgi:hypothetical protein
MQTRIANKISISKFHNIKIMFFHSVCMLLRSHSALYIFQEENTFSELFFALIEEKQEEQEEEKLT